MILIGEKLNSSIPKTQEAMKQGDFSYLKHLIEIQKEADYLDVNTAMCDNELEVMEQVVDLIIKESDCGIMLDSTNTDVLCAMLPKIENRDVIINSVTLDERLDAVSGFGGKCGIVALPICSGEVFTDAEKRAENAFALIDKCMKCGFHEGDIYIDVLAQSVATDSTAARVCLDTIRLIRKENRNVHLTCGLSNISFGLPGRSAVNSGFLISAVTAGLDSAILDVSNPSIISALHVANLLNGEDEYCMDYITYFRNLED